ncbi:kinesin-like protein KIN-14S isoform X2 [Fagus crenata]
MVARTPQKHKKMVAPINPVLLRETVKKNLKKEHTVLSDQVKLTTDSFHVLQVQLLIGNEYELIKKYLEESSERKRLYNEVIELKGNIRVLCRCRPLNQNEITNGSTSILDFDSSQHNELQVICSDSSKNTI